jgi:hypothetical protein
VESREATSDEDDGVWCDAVGDLFKDLASVLNAHDDHGHRQGTLSSEDDSRERSDGECGGSPTEVLGHVFEGHYPPSATEAFDDASLNKRIGGQQCI